MECHVCRRDGHTVSGLNCPACARALLYTLRLRQAQSLLEKDQVGQKVAQVLDESEHVKARSSKWSDAMQGSSQTLRHHKLLGKLEGARIRIDAVTKSAADLKVNIEKLRKEVAESRTLRAQQRAASDKVKADLLTLRKNVQPTALRQNKGSNRQIDNTYGQIVASRVHQCRRATFLAGLRQVPRAVDGGKKTTIYQIHHLPVSDIRQLNSIEPAQVNAVLLYLTGFVCQVCKYLQVRLPAEIRSPHYDHATPVVFSPASSYAPHDPGTPRGGSPMTSKQGSLRNSRELEQRVAGRPRHLFVEKKLPRLAKESPVAYALFVEGIALLAWDVAWLCRTQGLPVAEKQWDDVCEIGRNLWLLLGTPMPDHSSLSARRRPQDPVNAIRQARGITPFATPTAPSALGTYSHGTARNNLDASAVPKADIFDVSPRGWAFANPLKIIDELKAALLTEMSGHDWELLDGREQEVEDNTDAEETVVVSDAGKPGAVPKREQLTEEKKGTSGWTKLKSRAPT